MEILYTVLAILAAQAILGGVFYLGYRFGRRRPAAPASTMDDAEKQRLERLQTAFRSIMSYDLDTAMRGKKNG